MALKGRGLLVGVARRVLFQVFSRSDAVRRLLWHGLPLELLTEPRLRVYLFGLGSVRSAGRLIWSRQDARLQKPGLLCLLGVGHTHALVRRAVQLSQRGRDSLARNLRYGNLLDTIIDNGRRILGIHVEMVTLGGGSGTVALAELVLGVGRVQVGR